MVRDRHREARTTLTPALTRWPSEKRKREPSKFPAKTHSRARPLAGSSFGPVARVLACRFRPASPRYGHSPCPGARPVAEIEAPELLAMIKAIEDRGVRNIAKRARETTGQIFRYAIAQGYSRLNPVAEFRASDILSPPQAQLSSNRRQRPFRFTKKHRGVSGKTDHQACYQANGFDLRSDKRTYRCEVG